MAIHCAYGLCNSDSRYRHKDYMKGVEFIPFPKPHENLTKCQRWVNACGRADFSYTQVTKDTYICTKHFVGEKGPTKENPHPVPLYLAGDHVYTHKIRKEPFRTRKTCCVQNCKGRATAHISLHRFPRNPFYLQKWLAAFKIKHLPKAAFACSQHFEKSNYHFATPDTKRRRLKLNAVPTLNLPDSSDAQKKSKKSTLDSAKEKIKAILQSLDNDEMHMDSIAEEVADKLLAYVTKAGTKPIDAQTIKRIITNGKSNGSLNFEKTQTVQRTPRSKRSMKFLEWAPVNDSGCEENVNKEADGNLEFTTIVKSEPPDDDEDDVIVKEEPLPESDEETDINNTSLTIKEEPLLAWEQPTRTTFLFNNKKIHVPDFIDCIKKPKQKECAVCLKKVASKEVCTFCPDCPGNPPLCLKDCFKIHHGY